MFVRRITARTNNIIYNIFQTRLKTVVTSTKRDARYEIKAHRSILSEESYGLMTVSYVGMYELSSHQTQTEMGRSQHLLRDDPIYL